MSYTDLGRRGYFVVLRRSCFQLDHLENSEILVNIYNRYTLISPGRWWITYHHRMLVASVDHPCGLLNDLLLGFVRTRVLISRPRLNNRATMEADILSFTGTLTPEAASVRLVVIAMGDDYWFQVFGLSYKALIEFSRAFLLVYRLLTLLFSCKTGLMESPNNGNNNSGTN